MTVEKMCGGAVQTNGYLVMEEGGALLIDAPEGMCDWAVNHLKESGVKPAALLLTHGHWDHIQDAAAIQEKMKIPVWIHQDSAILLRNPSIQAAYNSFTEIRPCEPDRILRSESSMTCESFQMKLLLCPGHCPGSLCFYFDQHDQLFGGDVIFAGGVGRWDLPGGSEEALFRSIQDHILPLPDSVEIYPGHGPVTTVGRERRSNGYLQSLTKS